MHSSNRRIGLALLIGSLALTMGAARAPDDRSLFVETAEGPIEGHIEDGVRAFTGIPFAAPPVGPLRFRAPQPALRRAGLFVADKPIPNCIQFGGENGTAQGSNAGASEDCLYLSVWAPRNPTGKPLPVMFWIYGSAFVESGPKIYDGAALARSGVIVVTPNYRLGLLGHMVHQSLDRPGERSGNYNIRDNVAALKWVRRNIRSFGGNPGNVTIFGQSAGGLAVALNLISPASRGLFQKAIIQSTHAGAATERPAIEDRGEVERTLSAKVVRSVGCDGKSDVAQCLRSLPFQKLVDAHVYIPHVDDPDLLPPDMKQALKQGRFAPVPLLIGNVNFEGAYYIGVNAHKLGHPITDADLPAQQKEFFGAAAEKIMEHYSAANYGSAEFRLMHALSDYRIACAMDSTRLSVVPYVPVFGYEMTEPAPEQAPLDPRYTKLPNVARHTSDLNYIFGGHFSGAFKTKRAQQLSSDFMRYWSNFAKFGTPDPTGREWPRFTPRRPVVMDLELPPKPSTDFSERHQCSFMRANGFVRY